MKHALLTLFSLSPLGAWAQEAALVPALRPAKALALPPSVPALTLTFSPLAVLDPNTSTLLFGAEYRLNQRVGVAVEYGTRFRALQLTGFDLTKNKNDYQYYKIKAEVRYYLPPLAKHPHQEMYVAFQPFFVPQTYTRYNDNFVRNDVHIGYNRADVEKTVTGLDVKIGFIWHYGPSWQLEVGGGLGVRYVTVAYQTDREFVEQRANQFQVNMFNQSEKPGSSPDFDVATVCKVGYRFGLRQRK